MDNPSIKIISPALKVASVIIIIAGLMAAQSIVVPLLLALFISIICAKPILWLEGKKVPSTLAILIVLGGIILITFGMGASAQALFARVGGGILNLLNVRMNSGIRH